MEPLSLLGTTYSSQLIMKLSNAYGPLRGLFRKYCAFGQERYSYGLGGTKCSPFKIVLSVTHRVLSALPQLLETLFKGICRNCDQLGHRT